MTNKESIKKSFVNTGIVGGSQLVNIVFTVAKTKAIAILLGPAGVGLIQLFTSILTLLQNIFSFGLGFSSVREISQNHADNNSEKLNITIVSLNKWVWFTGILGSLLIIIFSKNISFLTFGSDVYWQEVCLLSIALIFSNLAASKLAIIRGFRNMGDFARASILNSLFGLIISLPIYYLLRDRGIIMVIIITSIFTFLTNYFFSKKINLSKTYISLKESLIHGFSMVKLGLFMVLATFLSQASLHFIRVYIGDELGLNYVGYFAVGTTLTVTYMELIFSSMAADYFPKLSAINANDKLINKAVLDQTKIVVFLGIPLILFMYTFSEFIIIFLYSKDFIMAQTLLILMLAGVFIRLIGFPIGYVFLAKNKSNMFILVQAIWNISFILITLLLWPHLPGLTAVGISFIISYALSVIVNIVLLKKLTNFNYDRNTKKNILLFLLLISLYLVVSYLFSGVYIVIIKLVGLVLISYYCFRSLENLLEIDFILKIKQIITTNKE
tara:strand:+ start:4433 stop:5926 length:1494 start_codon:yes stop_codon:yes gene_type:complete